jgi:hypothetical protein
LATTCRKVFRRETVAWRKRNVFRKIRTWGNWGSLIKMDDAEMRMTPVQQWHGAGITGFKDKEETIWHRDPRRDGCPGS